jgi:subtilisin family serine protease
MSTPHVSGSFALMKQAFPNLSPAQVLQRLQATGAPIDYGLTTVRIDVGAATAGPSV